LEQVTPGDVSLQELDHPSIPQALPHWAMEESVRLVPDLYFVVDVSAMKILEAQEPAIR
jgi:hypothetical protein